MRAIFLRLLPISHGEIKITRNNTHTAVINITIKRIVGKKKVIPFYLAFRMHLHTSEPNSLGLQTSVNIKHLKACINNASVN